MADDPSRGQPGFDRLPGWPASPEADGSTVEGDPAPAASPGWAGARPARPEPLPAPENPPPPTPPPGRRRFEALRTRRGMVAAAVVVVLLLGAAVVAVAVSGGENGTTGNGGSRSDGSQAAVGGKDLTLLDGRLVVVAPEGWQSLESAADTASLRVNLREATGRELLATLVLTALPGTGPLDATLTIEGGTRFEVNAAGGPIHGTAVPDRGQVLAGAVRPNGRFLISLSVSALDNQPTDAALLQKLFTEQVAPQLRFP